MMSRTTTGLAVGLVLGLAAAAGGFWGFLITCVLGGVGWAVGAVLDGRLDLSMLSGRDGQGRGRFGGDGYGGGGYGRRRG